MCKSAGIIFYLDHLISNFEIHIQSNTVLSDILLGAISAGASANCISSKVSNIVSYRCPNCICAYRELNEVSDICEEHWRKTDG